MPLNEQDEKTYAAYNPGAIEVNVQFTDGFSMTVPAGEMRTERMISTSISDDGKPDIPKVTSLQANYPNPFNPTTTISFTLALPQTVTVEIFNITGQKIATVLQDQTLDAGSHNFTFDATELSSGLYIYQMRTSSGFLDTGKMMLIK